ncbi:EthD family reductase [Mesorhizobium sp. 131-2-1]|jgi:uncharacterized protein (TIGR02118 family)|uniref:EthD family reductase n=2 Tax=Mesorhizobium TaxID=68287 RepID=UPI001FD036E1|nr:EthD family reductase [Mesorhizobium sp. 131-2-1]
MKLPGEEAEAPQMVARPRAGKQESADCRNPPSRNDIGAAACLAADRQHQQDRNKTMAKMLVIYKTPADPEAFDRHYFEVHVPLAKKLPGLRRYDISRRPIIKRSAGEMPYLVGTLYFDSLADMQSAFATEIGIACAADRRILAPGDDDLTMLLFDVDEV